MKKYWNKQLNNNNKMEKVEENKPINICYNCRYYVNEPYESGCTHDSLYSKNGHIIESKNNRIIKFQESGKCPFKIISKMFK